MVFFFAPLLTKSIIHEFELSSRQRACGCVAPHYHSDSHFEVYYSSSPQYAQHLFAVLGMHTVREMC